MYRKGVLWSSIFLVLALLIYSKADAQLLSLANRKAKVGLSFRYLRNLVIIPVFLNGKGPFNFILDTGVGPMLLTDPGLLAGLNLSPLRAITIKGLGSSESLQAHVLENINISIGKHIKGAIPAAILDRDALNLSGFTGIPIHGLIGYDFFNSFTVQINYVGNKLHVFPSGTPPGKPSYERIPIAIQQSKPYVQVLVTEADGTVHPIKMVIDTGAGHPIALEASDSLSFTLPDQKVRALLGLGLSGSIRGYLARIKLLQIGNFIFKRVIASYPDSSENYIREMRVKRNGNLGNGILNRFHVVVNYSDGYIALRPNSRYKKAFEHNMSGMEFFWDDAAHSRLWVAYVEEGSAASDAGIREGDQLLDINLKPVEQLTIDEINHLFDRDENLRFIIQLYRHSENRILTVFLKLKKVI